MVRNIRAPVPPTPSTSETFPFVHILHPGYSGTNTLFQLPALDEGGTSPADSYMGVDYDTALTICGVVCRNSYNNGFFSHDQRGEERCDATQVLRAGEVYFFPSEEARVEIATSPYPVTASFSDWRPPTTEDLVPRALASFHIPASSVDIATSKLTDEVKYRDRLCRASGSSDFCEAAHLIPVDDTCSSWWISNMTPPPVGLENPNFGYNAIYLRADLHRALDARVWIPVVKDGAMVIHVLDSCRATCTAQFPRIWHNRTMQAGLMGVDKRCLLGRIAWAVFPMLNSFFRQRSMGVDGQTAVFVGGKVEAWNGDRFKSFFSASNRSRSSGSRSPKRKATAQPGEEDSGDWLAFWEEQGRSKEEEEEEKMALRGRKRRRRCSYGDIDERGPDPFRKALRAMLGSEIAQVYNGPPTPPETIPAGSQGQSFR